MAVKFNGGNPVYVCDRCRVILARADIREGKQYDLPTYCEPCAELELLDRGEKRHGE